jgi:hypothetical protein
MPARKKVLSGIANFIALKPWHIFLSAVKCKGGRSFGEGACSCGSELTACSAAPVRVRVRVTLQLTVSQTVCLDVEPDLGLLTRVFFF